jgi:hypothetical protein
MGQKRPSEGHCGARIRPRMPKYFINGKVPERVTAILAADIDSLGKRSPFPESLGTQKPPQAFQHHPSSCHKIVAVRALPTSPLLPVVTAKEEAHAWVHACACAHACVCVCVCMCMCVARAQKSYCLCQHILQMTSATHTYSSHPLPPGHCSAPLFLEPVLFPTQPNGSGFSSNSSFTRESLEISSAWCGQGQAQ